MAQEEYEHKLLDLARVARVVAGGRRFSFRAVVVYGNRNGRVAVGVAKGKDVARGIDKAVNDAKKHLVTVPIVEGTIPHMVEAKYASASLFLKPQRAGRGIIAGGPVRMICDLAGIKSISGKILSRTKNKLNIARATMKALQQLKSVEKPEAKIEEEGGETNKESKESNASRGSKE